MSAIMLLVRQPIPVRKRARAGRLAFLSVAALVLGAACVPSFGPFRLPAVEGMVADLESGEPIPGAEVFEWHRGAGLPGASQPVYHVRWTTTDTDGRFAFSEKLAPSPRMWALRTYDAKYDFFHPSYGLQRGGKADHGAMTLRGSLTRAAQSLRDVAPYCRGEHDDEGARHLAELACRDSESR